jgi:ribosomal protein S18 acetylase RimI-like enzyme
MTVIIRRADLVDIPSIAYILTLSFYPRSGWLFPLWRWSIGWDVRWRFLDASPRYACLVAIDPTLAVPPIVGTIEICTKPNLGQPKSKNQPYLFNLAVHPRWRRQGVATQLLLAVEPLVQQWGFNQVFMHVMAHNHPAHKLYSQSNYQPQQIDRVWGGVRLLLAKQLAYPTN